MNPTPKIVNIVGIRHPKLLTAYRLLRDVHPSVYFSPLMSETEENFRESFQAGLLVRPLTIQKDISDEFLKTSISKIMAKIQSEQGQVRYHAEGFLKKGRHYITCNRGDWWTLGEFLLQISRTHPLCALIKNKIASLSDSSEYDETIYVRFDPHVIRKDFETAEHARVTDDELAFIDRMVTIYDEKAAQIQNRETIHVKDVETPISLRWEISNVLTEKGII